MEAKVQGHGKKEVVPQKTLTPTRVQVKGHQVGTFIFKLKIVFSQNCGNIQ
jgi:hypothetical protein